MPSSGNPYCQPRYVPIESYKDNFKGVISFISIGKEHGEMDIAFQLLLPGVNFDLARAGKGKSHGWFFGKLFVFFS